MVRRKFALPPWTQGTPQWLIPAPAVLVAHTGSGLVSGAGWPASAPRRSLEADVTFSSRCWDCWLCLSLCSTVAMSTLLCGVTLPAVESPFQTLNLPPENTLSLLFCWLELARVSPRAVWAVLFGILVVEFSLLPSYKPVVIFCFFTVLSVGFLFLEFIRYVICLIDL